MSRWAHHWSNSSSPCNLLDVGVELIGADESGGLFGVNGVGLAAAGDFAFAADDGDHGGVAVFVDIDSICAGTKDGESEIGSVDLKGFVRVEALARGHGACLR